MSKPFRAQVALLAQAWSELLDLLYPPRCEICGRDDRAALCSECVSRIERIEWPYCQRCNVPFPPTQEDRRFCPDCQRSRSPLVGVRSAGLHTGVLRQAVLALKFHSARRLAKPLAQLIYERVLEEADRPDGLAVADIQVLVPVVLHPWRRRWRGFDQAVLITRALAQLWGVPMILAVRRVRFTRPQIDLEPDQRRRNLARAFTAAPNVRLDNKTVAIVDDVWTTGATMDACARAVRTAGAGRVYGLTVTRSVPSWHPAAAERHTVTGA